jgi:hypothetical protein
VKVTPVTPTDALASLAFTGNTSALSSSALAALTSRLSHHTSSERLSHNPTSAPPSPVTSKGKKTKEGKATDLPVPPWTAEFSVVPLTGSKEEGAVFNPYVEVQKEKHSGGTFGKKYGKEAQRGDGDTKLRASLSFLRSERERPGLAVVQETDDPVDAQRAKVVSQPGTVRELQEAGVGMVGSAVPRRMRNKQMFGVSGGDVGRGEGGSIRRWTLAMADVPDEVLVQELEKMRMEGREQSSFKHGTKAKETDKGKGEWRIGGEDDDASSDEDDSPEQSTAMHQSQSSSSSHAPMLTSALDDREWKTARRALLCCRELVRTERNYQARLRQLLSGETSTPPPGLVLTYVSALVRASEAFLTRLEDDPSAWGVSVAFVAVEEEAEAAFVAWAGVVGELFTGDSSTHSDEREKPERITRKLTRASRNSSSSNAGDNGKGGIGSRSRSSASISKAFGASRMESIYRKRGASFYELEGQGYKSTPSGMSTSTSTPRSPCTPSTLASPSSNVQSPALSAASSPVVGGMGMFTAALGTGLAYGISPSSTSTPVSEGAFGYGGAQRPKITERANGSAGTLSRTFSALKSRRMSVFSSSPSLTSYHQHSYSSPYSQSYHGHGGVPMAPVSSAFSPESSVGRKEGENKEKKKPSVRELAILPVQRVMRYVLQYRGTSFLPMRVVRNEAEHTSSIDLLENTPIESPSRGLVERALESAMRIAAKCDRAQDNSAFLRRT